MSRLTDALRARFGDDIFRRMAIAAVLTALLMGAVGVADPFYSPPEPQTVDTDGPPEQVALDALNATETNDYRMDWITPCDSENVTRRDGGCVFLRYTVERSDREFDTDNGEGYFGSGPDVYADAVSATYYDFPENPDRSRSRALNLWAGADRLDRSDLAATLASPGVETTVTESNGTIRLRTDNDTVASRLLGSSENASAPPDSFDGTVAVTVDAESGWLRAITIRSDNGNETDWQRYRYDRWNDVTVERPAGTNRPVLGWVFDAINREYRP
ncbi:MULTISPECIES: hypothetical protein [Halolamina]|uniref:Uncharacterized protein n=1 Tax=Halolamina pelagica TaxID=699431 RepID=A0A1I5QCQ5_9EURY|nr:MULTISPECIES: hypothetical protein [Halolamina]NHX35204.1 hypothetical protein [Halolamina sp. R1-12]SFP44045.1 hypothetical protein SAMN05216277_103365 [Halolamina pelagica]